MAKALSKALCRLNNERAGGGHAFAETQKSGDGAGVVRELREHRHRGTGVTQMKIEVRTSCGEIIEQELSDMSIRQLEGLLDQNSDRADVDPASIAAMREELAGKLVAVAETTREWADDME
jgi:hypothetical protein